MPSIHSVLASAIQRHQTCHPFILSYPVPSLYSRGTRFVIHSFCLIKCHPFIHAAPDLSFVHSVLSSAIPLFTRHLTCHPFILSYPVPSLYLRGTRFVIHSFCLIQCHRSYMYMWHPTCRPFILSKPVSFLYTRSTRHAIHSFCLIQCHLFKYAAPDMPSIHSIYYEMHSNPKPE